MECGREDRAVWMYCLTILSSSSSVTEGIESDRGCHLAIMFVLALAQKDLGLEESLLSLGKRSSRKIDRPDGRIGMN